MEKIIGIIGGMGPLATCDLFEKIITNTKAARDQEHIRVLIDSNTRIPDRTEAVLRGGPSPVPEILRSARYLEELGPDVLLLPCNTSHFYYEEIAGQLHTPLLHMPRLAVAELKRRGFHRVGLLATEGALAAGVYAGPLREAGIEALVPTPEEQRLVTELIYRGIKANDPDYDPGPVRRVLERLTGAGAETLLAGCTELSVAFKGLLPGFPTVDPQLILAREAIRFVGAPLVEENIDLQ